MTHRAPPRSATMRSAPIPWVPPPSGLPAVRSHSCYGEDATTKPEERLSIFHIKRDTAVALAFPDSNSVNRALRLLHDVAMKIASRARKAANGRRRATG